MARRLELYCGLRYAGVCLRRVKSAEIAGTGEAHFTVRTVLNSGRNRWQ